MNCDEVNLAAEKLKTLITYSMDEVAPEKESRIKIRTEPWINNEILGRTQYHGRKRPNWPGHVIQMSAAMQYDL